MVVVSFFVLALVGHDRDGAVDDQPIWLSVDGEVATAESGFTEGKHRQRLVVYRAVTG